MKLTVSLAQIAVARTDPAANLEKGRALVAEAAARGSDLVCFPEMWTTGFDWEVNKRIAAGHESVKDEVAALAVEHGVWISGSTLSLNDDGSVSNTHRLFDPSGAEAGAYSKAHLFSLMHEDRHEKAGDSLCLIDAPWGPTALAVCYDIRFPELFRTYALKGAVLALSPMAFPYPRLEHWKVLVRARAIENQMFVVGTNQVGSEDFGPDGVATYFGDSCVIDPWGDTIVEAGESEEALLTATVDTSVVSDVRRKMTVLEDRRPDLYELG
ncbi:MAG: carbon-nitrogen family hydrolase [Actinobacteria bacterium]|nr:carbon-nitrogen family hydrolase [Actinomycetota bacterium]MBU1943227.1 carbon-nitrogen family hydrolase [Actinomycetota bacterium]MBU2685950.1 carbon-nitrogen family hydrolase [Actinomycetota bacterium]